MMTLPFTEQCQRTLDKAGSLTPEQSQQLIDRLKGALAAEDEAKDAFWAVYPEFVKATGSGINAEAARTKLADRALAAEKLLELPLSEPMMADLKWARSAQHSAAKDFWNYLDFLIEWHDEIRAARTQLGRG